VKTLEDEATMTADFPRAGGSIMYKFEVKNRQEGLDLSVILTTFSDWSDPDLYMSAEEHPTPETAQWKSDVW
jgi:hypothetical protein